MIRVYSYGAKHGPSAGADLVEAQIQRAHRYYNVLTAIEIARRAEADGAEDDAGRESVLERAKAKRREERARNGLYWGTYLVIEAAVMAAARAPGEPAFRRWTGEGQIAVQFQGGIAVEELLAGEDRRARIVGDGKRRELWIRVGSQGRDPVWAVVPFVYHRPLPPGSVAKWLRLMRCKVGLRYEYSVQITIEESDRVGGGVATAAAVDVGWRRVEGGMRVAAWVDAGSASGELLVPDALLDRWEKCEDLVSIRRKNFSAALAVLVDARRGSDPSWPAWLVEETRYARQWLMIGKLAGLALRWRGRRFDGDGALYSVIEAWRAQDRHLLEWEAHARQNVLDARRELYRRFASELVARHGTIVVEKLDLRSFAELVPVADDDPRVRASRPRRFKAGLSALLGALANAARREGRDWLELPAANTTRTCSACGALETFDAGADLWHTCSVCATRWDQDMNACLNLLRAAESGAVTSGRSRGGSAVESDVQRRRREAKATRKKGRSQTAVEPPAVT